MKQLPQLNELIKCFDKINENVGVNRAPVRIRHSGRAKDSGRDIFEKEKLITRKIKELNRASPGFGSDSPFGSDRAWGLLQTHMPQYEKFMKDILRKNIKITKEGIVSLTATCSAVIQKTLPEKR